MFKRFLVVLVLAPFQSNAQEIPTVAKDIYQDFGSAIRNLRNSHQKTDVSVLRPAQKNDPLNCDVTSAQVDRHEVFKANVYSESSFGGRSMRVFFEGKENTEHNYTYGLGPVGEAIGGGSDPTLVSRTERSYQVSTGKLEFINGQTEEQHNRNMSLYGDRMTPWYWNRFTKPVMETKYQALGTIKRPAFCLVQNDQEILIEISAQYVDIEGDKVSEYKSDPRTDSLSKEAVSKLRSGWPSQCYGSLYRVEWLAVCE